MKLTLKTARVNRCLSQIEAAEKLGISRSTLQSWETYKSYPTVDKLPKIEEVYKVKCDDLVFLPHKMEE